MKIINRLVITFMLCLAGLSDGVVYAEANVKKMPLPLPFTQSYGFHSKVLGLTLHIAVTVPINYMDKNTDKKYPAMYFTDGLSSGLFVSNSNILQTLGGTALNPAPMPEVITITIDFLATGNDHSRLRTTYYTPTQFSDPINGIIGGKADQFINFLQSELKPFVQSNFNVDEHYQTFAGHSLGGLFALYMLFTKPQSFDNYIATSPSIWWDNKIIFTYESSHYEQYAYMDRQLYMSVGLNEDTTGSFFSDIKIMATTIKSRLDNKLNFKMQAFEGENHNSVVIGAYTQGARFIFDARKNSRE